MRTKQKISLHLIGLMVILSVTIGAVAQQPSPSPSPATSGSTDTPTEQGEKTGDYTAIGSVEFGYRGLRFDGDLNKYQSDLNYKAGPRLFDSSFLLRSTAGKGSLFETFLVNSTGWGADPQGNLRVNVEQPEWYRFDATYRRFKYFRFLDNFANPNWVFSPAQFNVPPKLTTGEHGYDTRVHLGDFDLTLLPKNRRIRFNVGYSPERYSGPAYTTWHYGGDDFMFLSELRSQSNDFRVGADWKLGPVDFSFLQGFRRFKDDSQIDTTAVNLGVNPALNNAFLTSIERRQPVRGSVNYSRLSAHTFLAGKVDITARLIYSKSDTDVNYVE